MIKVTIDTRETNRIQSATEYFKEQGLEVIVEELEVGDYIFTDGNEEVVFEFKMIPDFIASIQDGRVFNQCIEQSERYNYHFCIIHGDEHTRTKTLAMTKNFRRVTIFQYLGVIASINRYSTVIESYSPFLNESYYRMIVQARKCLSNKPIVKKFPKKHKNPAFNFLCYSVYGINSKKAQSITDTYNLHSLDDLFTLTTDDLTKIDGIGENTAQKIIGAIHGS